MYHNCRFPPPLSGPVARNSKLTIHSDCAKLEMFRGNLELVATRINVVPGFCPYCPSSISWVRRRQDDLVGQLKGVRLVLAEPILVSVSILVAGCFDHRRRCANVECQTDSVISY